MKNKRAQSLEDAVKIVKDGATVLIGGFGPPGVPEILIDGICDNKIKNLADLKGKVVYHD